MNRVGVDKITVDQKLKLLQLSLYCVLPKLASTETQRKSMKICLFSIFIEVFEQKIVNKKQRIGRKILKLHLEKKMYQHISNYCHKN